MIQLIVQDQELDLFKNEVFAISKAVSKVGQFDLRFGDVSISFNVPLTAKNNAIFRYISNLNNDNLGAFRRFEGEIREDDAILSSGFYQVLSTNQNKKEIKIRFFGGNSDWFDLIKDRFINVNYDKQIGNPNSTSYNLDDLKHSYLTQNIVNSWSNTDGYFYYLCDNGENSNQTSNTLEIRDFQCGVYEHTIFERIFNSVGIKTQGNLFNDPLFYQTIISQPTNISLFDAQNSQKFFTRENDTTYKIDKTTYKPIQITSNDSDPQWNGNTFTSLYNINELDFELQMFGLRSGILAGSDVDLRVEYTINLIPQPDILVTLNSTGDLDTRIESWTQDFFNVKVGDTFKFSIKENNPGPDDYFLKAQSYLYYILRDVDVPYEINNIVPKIKQSDFVKDIMFRSGVVSTYDSKKRVLTLNKFQDVDNNKQKAIDLTDKIDLSKDVEIDFIRLVNNYFKTSFVRYKEDNNDVQLRLFKNVAKLGLGDGEIVIDNDNLSDEGDVFKSQYSATKDVFTFPLSGDNYGFYLPYVPIFNSNLEEQDLQPRILIANPNTSIDSISPTFTDINFNSQTYSSVGYAYFAKQRTVIYGVPNPVLDNNILTLSFQNYNQAGQTYIGLPLLEKNYDLYKRILNNPVYLPIYLNLKNLDLQDYNPLIPVYLDFELDTGYYYFEEISQYKGDGSTTKVGLVKI